MKTPLTLKDFYYDLPEEQVAQTPLDQRDAARLLTWQNGAIHHTTIRNLADLVPRGSLFIVNDSKVIASRIRFKLPTGANAEFLLLEPTGEHTSGASEDWLALGRPMRKLREGITYDVGFGLAITVLKSPGIADGPIDSGPRPFPVRLSLRGPDLLAWLERHGEMPLPPYIERREANAARASKDKIRYQTVYAAGEGSVAAPTAGLHFTSDVIDALKEKGCSFASVTLHVGAGTFLPVKSHNISQHEMHSERFMVPTATLTAVEQAKSEGRPVIVVGTTALRSLEGLAALANEKNQTLRDLADIWNRTNIFIRPVYKDSLCSSWIADALMTNFHQPESTLLMLVSALVGYDAIKQIYSEAVNHGYRFFSYGDSSLLWLPKS